MVALGMTTLVACGASHAEPQDMSATEHRERARQHDSSATAHESHYDPKAERTIDVPDSSFSYSIETYNPTKYHLTKSGEEREHAAAHRKAAQALETFEHQQCGLLPPEVRKVCPLIGQIGTVSKLQDGVRLVPVAGVNADAMLAHMQCHVAYAATAGFEGMDACPLYVKGATIEREDGAITITADDRDAATAIRRRTEAHLGGSKAHP